MSDQAEVLKAIEATNRAFEEFKKTNDAKLEALQKSGATADFEAKLKAIHDDMASHKKALEDIEAKSRRPQMGADGKPRDEMAEKGRTAFRDYVRKGVAYEQGDYWPAEEAKSLSVTSGPDGGFAVPKVIDGMIDALAVNVSPVRSVADVRQTATQDYHILINTRGTTSGWVGEQQARTATNTPQLADITVPFGELYANPQATQQMLDDVFFNAEQWLAENVATEFARAEGAAHISGTGVNQPKGFLSGLTAATADATRAFGTIEHVATGASGAFKTLTSTVNPADDLFTLVSKMKAAYRNGCSWMTNKAVLFEIMGFKDYQGRYVFSPMTAPGTQDTILGYPIVEAEDIPTKAASSLSLVFANFKLGYVVVDRIGTRVIRDPFTNKPYVGFYTTKRSGGTIKNSEAIKVLKFI